MGSVRGRVHGGEDVARCVGVGGAARMRRRLQGHSYDKGACTRRTYPTLRGFSEDRHDGGRCRRSGGGSLVCRVDLREDGLEIYGTGVRRTGTCMRRRNTVALTRMVVDVTVSFAYGRAGVWASEATIEKSGSKTNLHGTFEPRHELRAHIFRFKRSLRGVMDRICGRADIPGTSEDMHLLQADVEARCAIEGARGE